MGQNKSLKLFMCLGIAHFIAVPVAVSD